MMSPRRSSIGSEAEEVMADSTRGAGYGVGPAEIERFTGRRVDGRRPGVSLGVVMRLASADGDSRRSSPAREH